MDVEEQLQALLVVSAVSVAAPFASAFLARLLVPQVVVLIAGGVLVGPQVAGLARPESVELVANVGLGFLFLLAGYELELDHFGERSGRLAVAGWMVSAVAAVAVTGVLAAVDLVDAYVPVALALTTTALGTLLPILRDHGMLDGPLGRFIMPAGAVGEFLPIAGIAIFLGSQGRLVGLVSLVVMCLIALGLALLPRLGRLHRIEAISREGEHATSQITLRLTMMLLLGLLVLASDVGLDVVLGAFLAGVVLRRWAPGDVTALEHKLDAVGYGFFIPVFFVSSGMGLDLLSIKDAPLRLVAFFMLLLVVRGLPAFVVYRHDLDPRQRVQMMLLTATSLPLLVALSTVGLESGHMLPENAAALIGAGVLSVMVFPALAVALDRGPRAAQRGAPGR
ncbi:cation:proton antiporter [Nocardioides sp. S-58]|uniref:Cation:proton antiporter n=1 Tax=Nocardioides renjunii TaxID=3095075 RepID=A0ABU5KB58_9ACTN|nr:cation:proton antiporter [Nocardioides sp. S-58]MDZ5662196.1 cation:proton antiporter [Nocardioides sp. S-58]